MKQIGIQIRQRRKMLGINQQTLADLAQISINTITKIENGEININFQKLYAILEVLGLELSLKIKNKEGLSMRQGVVYLNKERVGIITELSSNEYKFRYDDEYFNDPSKPSISLTLTKQQQEYTSHYLFPFFANMLSEGHNRIVQARLLQIDEKDDFGILLATAHTDTAGGCNHKTSRL